LRLSLRSSVQEAQFHGLHKELRQVQTQLSHTFNSAFDV